MKPPLDSLGPRALWRIGLAALILVIVAGQSPAALLTAGGSTVGTLDTQGQTDTQGHVDTPGPTATSDMFQGGANFWAHWTLNGGQSQVNAANVRWLQMSDFSKTVPGFPNSNRPFIDPQQGQMLSAVDMGDAQPWYDITGPTQGTLSFTGGGADPWMGDGPSAVWGYAPLSFTADTMVVEILNAAAKQARFLGGVSWGYSISTTGGNAVTIIPVSDLANTQALRDTVNTALANDFPGWTLVVPEPSTLLLAATGALGTLVLLIRRRHASGRA